MTFRGYHARLIAITQNRLRIQREMAMSVLIGIAGAFSGKKGEGLEGILKGVESHISELDDAIVEVLGGRQTAKEVLSGLAGADVGDSVAETAVARQKQMTKAARSVADVQRDIRKLDVIMSNLTGSVVRNPAGGYGSPGQGPSMYSIGKSSITDQLGRV